jgi:UDP-N-acetylglucosamine acyltransferase
MHNRAHLHLSAFPIAKACHTFLALHSPLIHPTAIISPLATIADDVVIGPFSVIDGPAEISAGVTIDGHVLIRGLVKIAAHCKIGWGSVIGADPQDLHFDPRIHSGVIIGENNTIREYVTIHRGSAEGKFTAIGTNNFLMTGVHLAHDVQMGDYNVIANNVLLAGHITIGDRCFLGGGSGYHQFICIGDYAIVQGNAAISQDVPPYCMAHSQNKLSSLNVIGLKRAGFSPEQRLEIKKAFRLLLCSGNLTQAITEAEKHEWSPSALRLLDAVRQPSRKGILTRSNNLNH